MTPRHRSDDDDDIGGVLRRGSHAAWRLLLFIGIILGAGASFLVFDKSQARAAATEVVGERVGPLEKRLDTHLTEDKAAIELGALRARQTTEALDQIRDQLRALCRASARPQVCLGEK